MRVIAMAYGFKPLDRALVRDAGQTVFVAADQRKNADGTYRAEGIGFPRSFVFRFSDSLLARLENAWDQQNEVELKDLWGGAESI